MLPVPSLKSTFSSFYRNGTGHVAIRCKHYVFPAPRADTWALVTASRPGEREPSTEGQLLGGLAYTTSFSTLLPGTRM